MLPQLTRKDFLDRHWDAGDLDATAEFWLRGYEEGARAEGFRSKSRHDTEIRLRGFPRTWGDTLMRELARRAGTSDFAAPEVELRDPDTLVIASGTAPADQFPPVGLGLPLLAGDGFDGLFAEVRFRVAGRGRRLLHRVAVESTLVLVGEIRGGRFVLKTLWRTGADGWEDETCWAGIWPHQDECLKALDRFRETGEVPQSFAKKLFVPRGADRSGGLVVRLIRAPLDRPRLRGLVLRGLIFAALFAVFGVGAWAMYEPGKPYRLLPFGAFVVFIAWLAVHFVRGEARLFFGGYEKFRSRYRKLYEETVKHLPLTRAEGDARADHPWTRKFTADLEAAGFVHAGDVRTEPQIGGDSVTRVFLAPDGTTYLSVLFAMTTHPDPADGFRMWPAAVVFLASTFFPNGGRASSLVGKHVGFRKKRTGPEHLIRLFPDTADPVEFSRWHAGVAEEFAKEASQSPLRHERFDLYLRRLNDAQEEERRLYAEHPYTWGDHLRWYLQRPWWEYRAGRTPRR